MIDFSNTQDGGHSVILERTLQILAPYKQEYERGINIGFGVSLITPHLPAKVIHEYDIAGGDVGFTGVLPTDGGGVIHVTEPVGMYDLVVSMGTLYDHFDHEWIYRLIMSCAKNYILIGGVDEWLIEKDFGTEVISYAFPAATHGQRLTLYKIPHAIN